MRHELEILDALRDIEGELSAVKSIAKVPSDGPVDYEMSLDELVALSALEGSIQTLRWVIDDRADHSEAGFKRVIGSLKAMLGIGGHHEH